MIFKNYFQVYGERKSEGIYEFERLMITILNGICKIT